MPKKTPDKDPADMTPAERMAALAHEMHLPSCVTKADKILELIAREWGVIYAMRESVAQRHGDATPAPAPLAGNASNIATHKRADERPTFTNVVTIADLIGRYREETTSPYRNLRYKTRIHYDTLIKRVLATAGDKKLDELNEAEIRALYAEWEKRGTSIAHAQIAMLRVTANFVRTLGDLAADRFAVTLHRMHFSVAKARTEALTPDQAKAVRKKLKDMGFRSMALAQAFQFDLSLRQKDVIGEWLPVSEPGDSDVFGYTDEKWVRGLRWEEIDDDFVLRHVTIDNRGNEVQIEVDLKQCTMVMEELQATERRKSGPVIVCENTGLPWSAGDFRKQWRKAAQLCGIPKTVKNMDSRVVDLNTDYRRKSARPALRVVAKSN